jgi:uracil-DNA glycosylase family 4
MSEYVPPSGPLDAKIILCGEAPGREEVELGQPFVGASGRLLSMMLGSARIDRSTCYLTNVVKTRPENNDFGTLYLDKKRRQPSDKLVKWIDDLHKELSLLKPNVIIPLGGEALRAITGLQPITAWRGSIVSSPFGKCVATFHPAGILREYSNRTIAEKDLRRAREESTSPNLVLPQPHFEINPTYERVMEFLAEVIKTKPRLAFDIETTHPHIRCLGLADGPLHALCIPFISSRWMTQGGSPDVNNHWSEGQEYEILKALHLIFANPTIQKVAQNFPFDATALQREFGFEIQGFHLDTMVAHHTCYAELPKGLDFLASLYTRIPYYSNYSAASDESTWTYNSWDCVATYEIATVLEKEMVDLGVSEFYFNHLHPCISALTRTQHWGVLINQPLRQEMTTKYEAETEELSEKINKVVGSDFNPKSTKQMKGLFYDKLKLPVQYKPHSRGGAATLDKSARSALAKQFPAHKELLGWIDEYKERTVLLSGFLKRELDPHGRIRTSYNLAGTVTGRLSSSEPIWYPGTNLQNIPVRTETGKLFRRLFVADPGCSFIKADLSQAEFRLVVWLAQIQRLVDRYREDPSFDVHRWVASLIYRKLEKNVTKEERSIAKNGVYGGNYGMSPRRAAETYKLDLRTATFVLDSYRQAIPEIPLWWLRVQSVLKQTRRIRSVIGRLRIFLDRLDDQMFRDAYSHSAQSLVADIVNRALTLAVEVFDEKECHPVLQVHDEIVFQCKTELVPVYMKKIKLLMEYPLHFPGVEEPCVVPVDLSFGPNWLDQTKVEV